MRLYSFLMLIGLVFSLHSQSVITSEHVINYIEAFRNLAQEEMLRSGIPASIKLAQAIHESNCGRSVLATEAKNHFGIKCHKEWSGPGYIYDDDAKGECFRIYNSVEHSYRDHSDFLTSRPRYASLFTLDRKDYKSWAHGLKAAGYATNPRYAEILIKLIEDYKLYEYDDLQNSTAKKEQEKKDSHSIHSTNSSQEAENERVQEKLFINGIACIEIQQHTTPEKIAQQHHIEISRLLKYNDLVAGDMLKKGNVIFLAPKKNKGDVPYHLVKEGESMWNIAQLHGIKIRSLYKKNRMQMNDQPLASETIYLMKRRPSPPRTMSYEEYLKKSKQQLISPSTESISASSNSAAPVVSAPDRIYHPVTTRNFFVPAEQIAADHSMPSQIMYYTVQPKETLYGISRKFNTTVEKIKEWNGLSDNNIKVGQQLLIKQ
ncbi:MAG: LysM peptidoglycan-binding domain-containing protein [Chitinophagales bacterium]|nr:LysM peptidoglycan-binding domain-containing protein [Chitinophagales bacterium]MDW8274159.1 LysM peptidoglycan-binding domain-containing protein [Chitinophagales bacterium]